jgi:acyl-coenzyme A thioesterase PaaI-like protein
VTDRHAGQSLQEQYAPESICYGCGPANAGGFRIRSIVEGDEVVARWMPLAHHHAFPGMLNGGVIGTLLDCHCNWAAAYHLMQAQGLDTPPCTVTADYTITLKRPTPMNAPVVLRARVVESQGDRALVEGTLEAGGKITATCRGTFVAVKPGHPAYHRW